MDSDSYIPSSRNIFYKRTTCLLYTSMPVIVRDLDDDAATIIMVDSNLQRESLLPSERAFALSLIHISSGQSGCSMTPAELSQCTRAGSRPAAYTAEQHALFVKAFHALKAAGREPALVHLSLIHICALNSTASRYCFRLRTWVVFFCRQSMTNSMWELSSFKKRERTIS